MALRLDVRVLRDDELSPRPPDAFGDFRWLLEREWRQRCAMTPPGVARLALAFWALGFVLRHGGAVSS